MAGGGPEDEDEEEAFLEEDEGEVVADLEGGGEEDEEDDDAELEDPGEEEGPGGSGDVAMGGFGGASEAPPPAREDAAAVFGGHDGEAVFAVAWGPPGTPAAGLAASGGADDLGWLWRPAAHAPAAGVGPGAAGARAAGALPLSGHSDSVVAVGFASDGTLLATGGMDGRVLVWEGAGLAAASGSGQPAVPARALEGPGDAIEALAWHPRGPVVAAASADFSCWMWAASSGTCMQVFTGHAGPVASLRFVPDGRRLASAGADGTVRVWDPRTGTNEKTFQGHGFHTDAVTCLDASLDSTLLLSGSADGSVGLSGPAMSAGFLMAGGHAGQAVEAVAFSPAAGGNLMAASAGLDGRALVWDLQARQARAELKAPGLGGDGVPAGLIALAWTPGGALLVTGGLDARVRVWDARSGQARAVLEGHRVNILCLSVAPAGDAALAGSDDGTARAFPLPPA